MSFRVVRLKELLRAKRWEPKDLQRVTRLTFATLNRILKDRGLRGAGDPSCESLSLIAFALEIDADYLLDIDPDYEGCTAERAASRMALDLYLAALQRRGIIVEPDELERLEIILEKKSTPPVWVREWEAEHESIALTGKLDAPSPSPPTVRPRRVRRGSIRN